MKILHMINIQFTDGRIILLIFQINYEFSLMHENSVKNFVDIWPAGAPKIVQKGPEVCRTPALQKFLMEEASKFFSVDCGIFKGIEN